METNQKLRNENELVFVETTLYEVEPTSDQLPEHAKHLYRLHIGEEKRTPVELFVRRFKKGIIQQLPDNVMMQMKPNHVRLLGSDALRLSASQLYMIWFMLDELDARTLGELKKKHEYLKDREAELVYDISEKKNGTYKVLVNLPPNLVDILDYLETVNFWMELDFAVEEETEAKYRKYQTVNEKGEIQNVYGMTKENLAIFWNTTTENIEASFPNPDQYIFVNDTKLILKRAVRQFLKQNRVNQQADNEPFTNQRLYPLSHHCIKKMCAMNEIDEQDLLDRLIHERCELYLIDGEFYIPKNQVAEKFTFEI